MKNFKAFLSEEPQWYKPVSDYLYHDANYFPLTSRLTQKLLGQRKTAYHICNLVNFKILVSKQNTRTTVSATLDPEYIVSMGEWSTTHAGTGIIAEIEGQLRLHTPVDAGTGPDSAGRRWVTLGNLSSIFSGSESSLKNTSLYKQLKELEQATEKLRVKTATEFLGHPPETGRGWWSGFMRSLSNNRRLFAARRYFSGLYKLVEQNGDLIVKVLTSGISHREISEYDEVVLDRYRIISVAVDTKIKQDYTAEFGNRFPAVFFSFSMEPLGSKRLFTDISKFTGRSHK